jgi:hypothetical protein
MGTPNDRGDCVDRYGLGFERRGKLTSLPIGQLYESSALAHVWSWQIDLHDTYTFCSNSAVNVPGYLPQQAVGEKHPLFFAPKTDRYWKDGYEQR